MAESKISEAPCVTDLRESRLNAYRERPDDISSQYTGEGENEEGYYGRFAYELIQNADDVLGDTTDPNNPFKARFELETGENPSLIVANTGPPIDKKDAEALTTIGGTTKRDADRKATIGHKGRGFSAVLEITDSPYVYSTDVSFMFDRERSHDRIKSVVDEVDDWDMSDIAGIPLMRLPFAPDHRPERIEELFQEGYETVFYFPLKNEALSDVKEALNSLDDQTALFLNNLKRLEIAIDDTTTTWRIGRHETTLESIESEVDTVKIQRRDEDGLTETDFVRFTRDSVAVGDHTRGISNNTWGELSETQVSVAVQKDTQDDGTHLQPVENVPMAHVFLPTEERSPVPLLVNAAFDSDLARKSIDITRHKNDYNRFLIHEAADIVATDIAAIARNTATTANEFLSCLNFTTWSDPKSRERHTFRDELIRGLQDKLTDVECIPIAGESDEQYLAPFETLVPSVLNETRNTITDFISQYGEQEVSFKKDESVYTGYFPDAQLLDEDHDYIPDVLKTLGACEYPVEHLPHLLPQLPDDWFSIDQYPPSPQNTATDPVVELLASIWPQLDDDSQDVFAKAARREPLVPVGTPDDNGMVTRVRAANTELYRPREDGAIDVDVPGVQFITEYIYRPRDQLRGQVLPKVVQQRQNVMNQVWRPDKFQFNELVRSTVDDSRSQQDEKKPDVTIDLLTLLKELGTETADSDNPLPLRDRYDVQPLYRLCRLPVPTTDGNWIPACRVYFGSEWLQTERQQSVETLFDVAEIDAPFVVSPTELETKLNESGLTNDEDVDLESWYEFLRWIGVTPHLRLKPFFDPTEQRRYSETVAKGGIQRPSDGASVLGDLAKWEAYQEDLEAALDQMSSGRQKHDSIYSVNSFEYWPELRKAARKDRAVGQHLIDHLITWWKPVFSDYRKAILATHKVSGFSGRNSSSQSEDEYRRVGTNLWLWQLRTEAWCPSTRGALKPSAIWDLPGGQRNPFTVGDYSLLPVLQRTLNPSAYEAQPLFNELDVRQHLSSETFKPGDAKAVCEGLVDVCNSENVNIADSLRELQPIYRKIQDLSPKVDQTIPAESPWADATELLQSCPVLCRVEDSFVFKKAENAYFIRSPSVRSDYPFDDLPFFILEEQRAARFGEYFGLHDFKATVTEDGDQIDERKDRTEFVKDHLRKCAPYILCRLEAERPSQKLIDQDCSRMESFLKWVRIYDTIEVTYTLDPIGEEDARQVTQTTNLYIDSHYENSIEQRHPHIASQETDRGQWQLLAHALCTYLDVTQFEGIDALLAASTDSERQRYLQYAGAPSSTDAIEQRRQTLFEEGHSSLSDFGKPGDISKGPAAPDEETKKETISKPVSNSKSSSTEGNTTQHKHSSVLYDNADLRISGERIIVEPSTTSELNDEAEIEIPDESDVESVSNNEGVSETAPSRERHNQSQYDVEDLGAALVKTWEEIRIRDDYPDCEEPSKYIFDTSEREQVKEARESEHGKRAFQILDEKANIPEHFPGFDILTINPYTKEPDRLIELKSATSRQRKPSISWNEWTTARNEWIQTRDEPLYYLYVVGHLSKQTSSDPYIRTIPDPFGLLDAQLEQKVSVTKSVQVDVNAFPKVETVPETEGVREIPISTVEEPTE